MKKTKDFMLATAVALGLCAMAICIQSYGMVAALILNLLLSITMAFRINWEEVYKSDESCCLNVINPL